MTKTKAEKILQAIADFQAGGAYGDKRVLEEVTKSVGEDIAITILLMVTKEACWEHYRDQAPEKVLWSVNMHFPGLIV